MGKDFFACSLVLLENRLWLIVLVAMSRRSFRRSRSVCASQGKTSNSASRHLNKAVETQHHHHFMETSTPDKSHLTAHT